MVSLSTFFNNIYIYCNYLYLCWKAKNLNKRLAKGKQEVRRIISEIYELEKMIISFKKEYENEIR